MHQETECQCGGKCVACEEGIEGMLKKEQALIEKYGWAIRMVPNEYTYEGRRFPSYYTVGLTASFRHPELELVLPVGQRDAMYILNTLGEHIKEGDVYSIEGLYRLKAFNQVPIRFLPAIQGGSQTPVLRVCLADVHHKLPQEEGCEPVYRAQAFVGRESL